MSQFNNCAGFLSTWTSPFIQTELPTNHIDLTVLQTNDVQASVPSQPMLPEPGLAEEISLTLLELVKQEPGELELELKLKELSKKYSVGIKPLRGAYKSLKESYLAETVISVRSTDEEQKIKAESEQRDRR